MKPMNLSELSYRDISEKPTEKGCYLIVVSKDNDFDLRSDIPLFAEFDGADFLHYHPYEIQPFHITEYVSKWMPLPDVEEVYEGQADLLNSATEELLSQVVNMAVQLSQEVQDYIDEDESIGGDAASSSQWLLADWNQLYQKVREFE